MRCLPAWLPAHFVAPHRTAQALVGEKQEHQEIKTGNSGRASQLLSNTQFVAEGLFAVSASTGGRGAPGDCPFDKYACTMGRVPGREPGETQAPDAFDVSVVSLSCFAFVPPCSSELGAKEINFPGQ